MATFVFRDNETARAASSFFTLRLLMLAFTMVCLLVMPLSVFRCEIYVQFHSDSDQLRSAAEALALKIWIRSGVLAAALWSISALSFESLMQKSTRLLALVTACDGCCGLVLVAEVVWSLCAKTHLAAFMFESLPFFAMAAVVPELILGPMLMLLGVRGMMLHEKVLKERQGAERDLGSDGQAGTYATVRMFGIGFATLCFLILPMVVFAIEIRKYFDLELEQLPAYFPEEVLEQFQELSSLKANQEIANMIMATLLDEGMFAVIFLSFSALSFRSLRSEDDGFLTLVAGCDGCCGLLLAAVAVLSMRSGEAEDLYSEHLPAFSIVEKASHLILAMLLVLLAALGFRLRGARPNHRLAAERVADFEGKAAVVSKVAAAAGADAQDIVQA